MTLHTALASYDLVARDDAAFACSRLVRRLSCSVGTPRSLRGEGVRRSGGLASRGVVPPSSDADDATDPAVCEAADGGRDDGAPAEAS